MSKFSFLFFFLPCIVSCIPDRPHILFVLMDDQGYDDIGYTYPEIGKDLETPLFDSLAYEGLILDRFYTSWLCTPSRASLMTGKYPIAVGIGHDLFLSHTMECLDEGEILIPEPIRANGYATHLVGKWHLGYARWDCMPCLRGFDTAYGYIMGAIYYLSHELGNYHDFYSCNFTRDAGISTSVLPHTNGIYSMELFGQRAEEILEDHDPDQPIFLYMPLQTVHSNPDFVTYYAPDKFYSEWCNDTSHPRCTTQAMLNAAEDTVNRTISKLKEKGMWNNTLMVYVSDNGAPNDPYHSNRPLRGYKMDLYEGGVRTPGFIYSVNPDILAVRGRTSCYVHMSDWYSTLVTLTGGWAAYRNSTNKQMPQKLDSIDQSSLLITGETETCQRTEIMVHIDPVERIASYIKGDFKVLFGSKDGDANCTKDVWYPFNASSVDWNDVELYNITSDWSEKNNIAESYPDVVAQLQEALLLYMGELTPLQCQLPPVANSFPTDDVPFYLPWDFQGGVIPPWATYALY